MNVIEFGEALLETEDLDPVYCTLVRGALPEDQLKRWLMAYWCFYDMGTASVLSEFQGEAFWKASMANLKTLRRGAERRHFRGDAAKRSVLWLSDAFPRPEFGVDAALEPNTFEARVRRVRTWRGFGLWIGFKAADMLERVLGSDVRLEDARMLEFYDEPSEAARMINPTLSVSDAASNLLTLFRSRGALAPPDRKRPVNFQEIETILCKWKSHVARRYPVGKDSLEVRLSLERADCETAQRLAPFVPLSMAEVEF